MLNNLISTYKSYLPCEWQPKEHQLNTLRELISFSNKHNFVINENFDTALIEAVNQKLSLNKSVFQRILDTAFSENIILNYIHKIKIKFLLDCASITAYENYLVNNSLKTEKMMQAYIPVSRNSTLSALNAVFYSEENYSDVYDSIFSRFCFNLFDKKCALTFFSEDKNVNEDFFSFISDKYSDICKRNSALGFIDVPEELFLNSYSEGCNKVLFAIQKAYKKLNNHCELAVHIPPIKCLNESIQWRLYSDIILYAEKHIRERIDRPYFRWKKIATTTCNYIKRIIPYNAEFEVAFQGFVFKDCYILNNNTNYSLILILEKNERDEREINCPACYSNKIQGNSYPILNVKSWECENPLCPDRSKYNRGKRYAFISLFRQKQILEENNVIPYSSISKWHLDCVDGASKDSAFEMVIRHYSCAWDEVFVFTNNSNDPAFDIDIGRKISFYHFATPEQELLLDFKKSTYFYRYIQNNENKLAETKPAPMNEWNYGKTKVILGDSFDVLRSMPDEIFDGAVTSPPYYNAKSYSQWPNIYCYLYDMYNISKEVFRVLKSGSVYLFNIFDYFDNENNIALSAMGNKRMILGAYMIDIFERIGFQICGNIIWNKGEIQGNRSFNQGNFTPYYQAPLNCWEHILILSKMTPSKKFENIVSEVRNIRPVVKMIRGKNILGHDAPYPKEIPELLTKYLNEGDNILDPFLGSGTTAIVANNYNINSVGIEKNEEYFSLCKDLIKRSEPKPLNKRKY